LGPIYYKPQNFYKPTGKLAIFIRWIHLTQV
jgi:hypothetical protein